MSNFLTAATSTTASSNNSPSRPDAPAPDAPLTLIACGALGAHIREIATRRGWAVEVACLPWLLHNRPERIRADAQRLARGAQARDGASRSPTRTAERMARSMSCASGLAWSCCAGCTATTCSQARSGYRRSSMPNRARMCSPTSSCAASAARYWPNSVSTSGPNLARLLRPLPACRLAGAAAQRRPRSRGAGRGRDVRPAADRDRRRRRGPGKRTRAAAACGAAPRSRYGSASPGGRPHGTPRMRRTRDTHAAVMDKG